MRAAEPGARGCGHEGAERLRGSERPNGTDGYGLLSWLRARDLLSDENLLEQGFRCIPTPRFELGDLQSPRRFCRWTGTTLCGRIRL